MTLALDTSVLVLVCDSLMKSFHMIFLHDHYCWHKERWFVIPIIKWNETHKNGILIDPLLILQLIHSDISNTMYMYMNVKRFKLSRNSRTMQIREMKAKNLSATLLKLTLNQLLDHHMVTSKSKLKMMSRGRKLLDPDLRTSQSMTIASVFLIGVSLICLFINRGPIRRCHFSRFVRFAYAIYYSNTIWVHFWIWIWV